MKFESERQFSTKSSISSRPVIVFSPWGYEGPSYGERVEDLEIKNFIATQKLRRKLSVSLEQMMTESNHEFNFGRTPDLSASMGDNIQSLNSSLTAFYHHREPSSSPRSPNKLHFRRTNYLSGRGIASVSPVRKSTTISFYNPNVRNCSSSFTNLSISSSFVGNCEGISVTPMTLFTRPRKSRFSRNSNRRKSPSSISSMERHISETPSVEITGESKNIDLSSTPILSGAPMSKPQEPLPPSSSSSSPPPPPTSSMKPSQSASSTVGEGDQPKMEVVVTKMNDIRLS